MTRKLCAVALVACACIIPGAAGAQIKAEHPRFCVMSVGPTQMMFSAIQDQRTDDIFCQHVPATGPTRIILDARHPELRDMVIEVRILRDVGQKDWRDDLDANTVASLPAKKYLAQNGTVSFVHDFGTDGDFVTVVRARSEDGKKDYVGEYRFSVGETVEWYAAYALLGFAVAAAAVASWRNRARSIRIKRAASAFRQAP